MAEGCRLAGVTVPGWLELVVIVFAAFRTWHLVAEDTVADRPRRWVLRLGDWKPAEKGPDPPPPDGYREGLALWIQCPWCSGFWVAVVWWGAFELWPHGTTVAASVLAIAALVALVAKASDRIS